MKNPTWKSFHESFLMLQSFSSSPKNSFSKAVFLLSWGTEICQPQADPPWAETLVGALGFEPRNHTHPMRVCCHYTMPRMMTLISFSDSLYAFSAGLYPFSGKFFEFFPICFQRNKNPLQVGVSSIFCSRIKFPS